MHAYYLLYCNARSIFFQEGNIRLGIFTEAIIFNRLSKKIIKQKGSKRSSLRNLKIHIFMQFLYKYLETHNTKISTMHNNYKL